jgi:hypothetical protein
MYIITTLKGGASSVCTSSTISSGNSKSIQQPQPHQPTFANSNSSCSNAHPSNMVQLKQQQYSSILKQFGIHYPSSNPNHASNPSSNSSSNHSQSANSYSDPHHHQQVSLSQHHQLYGPGPHLNHLESTASKTATSSWLMALRNLNSFSSVSANSYNQASPSSHSNSNSSNSSFTQNHSSSLVKNSGPLRPSPNLLMAAAALGSSSTSNPIFDHHHHHQSLINQSSIDPFIHNQYLIQSPHSSRLLPTG